MKLVSLAICLLTANAFAIDSAPTKTTTTTTTTSTTTTTTATPATKKATTKMMAEKSLYERLGGESAVTAVIDDFVGRAASNPKVNFFRDGKFKNTDVPKLKKHLVQFVSMATGGPSKYEGRDMKTSHAGMKITNAEFGAIAGDLSATLDQFKVPAKEKNELMTIVSGTKGAIVEN